MFFTKPYFFLLWLPLFVAAYWLLMQRRPAVGVPYLVALSLALYAYSSPEYLPLMGTLIVATFVLTTLACRAQPDSRKRWVAAAILVNLGVLSYYKLHGATFGGVPSASANLPLGISFFTITLIVYAYQAYATQQAGSLRNLGLVVSYFPHLAAGPILNYLEVDKQLDRPDWAAARTSIARGAVLFAIGLAKKLLLADSIGPYSDFAFRFAGESNISMAYAWLGAWAFLLELYFDFSGYTDMACGISLLFGIALPLNFSSPLKATSYVEVWNRWHMSLTRVLRELVFKPLGGLKKSAIRRNAALVATMVIGGLWHGATLNYFLFGLFSGLALAVNHAFRRRAGWHRERKPWQTVVSRVLTLATITATSVFFRSPDGRTIASMLRGMAGGTGVLAATPSDPARYVPESVLLQAMGLSSLHFVAIAAALTTIVLFARNSNELVRFHTKDASAWAPTFRWGLFAGILLALALASITHNQRFLYVNF